MNTASLDALLEDILTDAYNEEEQLWAFLQYFEDQVDFPVDAHIIGEPVSITGIDYDGNARLGLTGGCHKQDGTAYRISAAEIVLAEGTKASLAIAAYRRWLGLEPFPDRQVVAGKSNRHKASEDDIDLDKPVELFVLSVKEKTGRCLIPGSGRMVTLRSSLVWDTAPGWLVTVNPHKYWRYGGHPYLSGEIVDACLDPGRLGLVPLKITAFGQWDPDEEYWGEEGVPIADWAQPIIARGPRQQFEMEQILPGEDPDDVSSDPILAANDLSQAGDYDGARQLLMQLLEKDLRCPDAPAHLGNLAFDTRPKSAIRHYEAGLRIGELSLGEDFDGLLPWGLIDNRPFLRCLQGYGLCLWRLNRFAEAARAFDRLLWLNPADSLGVRFLIDEVKAGRPWTENA